MSTPSIRSRASSRPRAISSSNPDAAALLPAEHVHEELLAVLVLFAALDQRDARVDLRPSREVGGAPRIGGEYGERLARLHLRENLRRPEHRQRALQSSRVDFHQMKSVARD